MDEALSLQAQTEPVANTSNHGTEEASEPIANSYSSDDDVKDASALHEANGTAPPLDSTPLPTLRPSPPPSQKRKYSETLSQEPQFKSEKKVFKKRYASPPWNLPVADGPTTLKSADGRRISGRVNRDTPTASDVDAPARVRSNSRPQSASRVPSPPWKEVKAEGPTTITVDGKRKSGRVNKELAQGEEKKPSRVSPRSHKKKDVDSTAVSAGKNGKIEAMSRGSHTVKPEAADGETPHKRSHKSKPSVFHAQLDGPTSPKVSKAPGKNVSTVTRPPPSSVASPQTSRPRITIRLGARPPARPLPYPHPLAQPPSPPRPPQLNLVQLLELHDLRAKQEPWVFSNDVPPEPEHFVKVAETNAKKEAEIRQRLLRAGQPGGELTPEVAQIYQADHQDEPDKQYSHVDHLVAHALHLRVLQQREKTLHRQWARKLVQEAAEYVKERAGPTEEDIQAQIDREYRIIWKQVNADVGAKWDLVRQHCEKLRLEEWQRQEDLRREERLQRQLMRNEQLLRRQRGEADSDEDSIGDVSMSEEEASDLASEDMSSSESSADEVGAGSDSGEMTEEQLAEYLKSRGSESAIPMDIEPQTQQEAEVEEEVEQERPKKRRKTLLDGDDEMADANSQPPDTPVDASSAPLTTELDEVAPELLDSSSADGDEDDDGSMGNMSDEDMSSSEEEEEEENADAESERAESDTAATSEEPETSWIHSLLTKKEKAAIPAPEASDVDDEMDEDEDYHTPEEIAVPKDDGDKLDISMTDAEPAERTDPPELKTDYEATDRMDIASQAPEPADTETDPAARSPELGARDRRLTPVPTLLRGTLRSYQHAGLHWLATLYENGTNGILADEMGLGKTIQTISLLGHLAEEHQVWAPHLVIVPTSVLLNWVTEFQKFLPGFRVLAYYGPIEERREKRKHWVGDPHHENREKRGYNVVVTSYQIALKDLPAIRNVAWHYLVLDEAHNIKNFLSQRFQSLIRLRTSARLLLTGTPLQNSLTELWSLLTFLTAGDDDPAHGELQDFLSNWKEPVKEIFEAGVQKLSNQAENVVKNLHTSLRPFLLRRLKNEVEKDLPKKTEQVIVCKLSKRQRQLYNEFLGLSSTKEKLLNGNAVSAGSVLLSLRRVCNHPSLFAERPIRTSYAMPSTPVTRFEPKQRAVLRLLGEQENVPLAMLLTAREKHASGLTRRSRQLNSSIKLVEELRQLEGQPETEADLSTISGCRTFQALQQRRQRLSHLRSCIHVTIARTSQSPVYGSDLRETLTIRYTRKPTSVTNLRLAAQSHRHGESYLDSCQLLRMAVKTLPDRASLMLDSVEKFTFVTPEAVAPVLDYCIPPRTQAILRQDAAYPAEDPFAVSRTKQQIAFPDRQLLMYDSGKLQRLARLLRDLQSRGSRSLIFTQMTSVLDILEAFLNLLNLPYLRLDGSTNVERRALMAAEFNRPDSRYAVMILSSRAGGIGLNLTGASSVIFYDLDWNPQMDRQCMDRAHRIGQVRDVEVYKLVSEKTIEENILKRANQKSLLDEVVVQRGQFTTEWKPSGADDLAGAAVDRLFGGDSGNAANERSMGHVLASVEDGEDAQAARKAAAEENTDDFIFEDHKTSRSGTSVPPTPGAAHTEAHVEQDEHEGHVDQYMMKWMTWMLERQPFVPPTVRKPDATGRDRSHRKRKR